MQPDPAWPQKRLLSVRTWSQYFLTGNIIRIGIYMPTFWLAMVRPEPAVFFVIWFPLLIHVLFITVELYRLLIIKRTLHLAPEGEWHDRPRLRANFKSLNAKVLHLRSFESVRLYRAIGVELYHRFVMWYIGKALRGGSPQYLERLGPRYALDYAMDSMLAEKVHAAAATLNLTVTLLLLHCWWQWPPTPSPLMVLLGLSPDQMTLISRIILIYQAYWLFMEYYLVMVQRFIRVRILSALAKKVTVS
jgi:hypothetical protein